MHRKYHYRRSSQFRISAKQSTLCVLVKCLHRNSSVCCLKLEWLPESSEKTVPRAECIRRIRFDFGFKEWRNAYNLTSSLWRLISFPLTRALTFRLPAITLGRRRECDFLLLLHLSRTLTCHRCIKRLQILTWDRNNGENESDRGIWHY